jgi:hypothetical protein
MVILWATAGPRQFSVTEGSGAIPPSREDAMREYQPLSSESLLAIEHPRCPGCRRSRMVLCAVEPGPPGFDSRTFECQKCGHVHAMTVSRDPMASSLHGWLAGELKPPT